MSRDIKSQAENVCSGIIGRKCGCCSLDGMRSACPTSHTHYMLRGPRETVDWRQHGQGLSESLQEGERGGTL